MTIGIVLLVVSAFLFLLMMTVVLPKLFLKVRYSITEPEDIGIKRCFYNGKRCVIYEGGKGISKYIEKYLLVEGKKCKVLRCKLARKISYMDYDIVVFDRYNNVKEVVNVKENLVKGGYTRRVELPEETAYVRMVIRAADDTVIKTKPVAYIPKGKVTFYAFLAICLTAAETFVLKVSCAYAFGGVFRETFARSTNGFFATVVLALITGLIALITVTISIRYFSKR